METKADRNILANAGQLVDRHAMVWLRRLNAPIEQVWQTVSTKEGLEQWWVVPPSAFELRPGGVLKHHWDNTVLDYQKYDYIDFVESTGDYAGTGGMRFELQADGQSTMFMFLDTWAKDMVPDSDEGDLTEQPGGPGTPWPGVAAGWHAMMDQLETIINNRAYSHSYEDLCAFYLGYLRDLYRWHEMVQRSRPT